MVVIKRHDFCNLENRHPESTEIVGYASDEAEAREVIKHFPKETYDGYDRNKYPYYEITPIKHISTYVPYELKSTENQKETIHWHNLRYDPDDLPKKTGNYLVILAGEDDKQYIDTSMYYVERGTDGWYKNVYEIVKWAKISTEN